MNKICYSFFLIILSILYVSTVQANDKFQIEINNKSDRTMEIRSASNTLGYYAFNKDAVSYGHRIIINSNERFPVIGTIVLTGMDRQKEVDFLFKINFNTPSKIDPSRLYKISMQPYVIPGYIGVIKITGKMVFNEETGFSLEKHQAIMKKHYDECITVPNIPVACTCENGKIILNITNSFELKQAIDKEGPEGVFFQQLS